MRVFAIGFFCLSILLGYVAAASASPVVSSFLPALVGLVISILTAITIRKETNQSDTSPVGQNEHVPLMPVLYLRFGGLLLLLFVCGFIIGSVLGALSRSHGWFTQRSIRREFPWRPNLAPPSTEVALCWISIQSKMEQAGYKSDQVKALYQTFEKQYGDASGDLGRQQNLVTILHMIALKEPFLQEPSKDDSIYKGE